MRGIPSLITDIRKKVFTEVARMAYNGGDYTNAEDLPYVIVPGDQPSQGLYSRRGESASAVYVPAIRK